MKTRLMTSAGPVVARAVAILSTLLVAGSLAGSASAQDRPDAVDEQAPASLTREFFDIPRPRRLIPEGTFVVSRAARLIPVDRSSMVWVVEFENEPGLPLLPAMYLMPSRRLQRLETSLFAEDRQPSDEELHVSVSGQVFAFDRYNFLMLTAMPRAVSHRESTQPAANESQKQTDSASAESGGQTNDGNESDSRKNLSSDVEAMIKELESESPVAPILERPAEDAKRNRAPGASGAGTTRDEEKLLTEGTFILNRAVRLVRSPINGAWTVVFEADSDGLEDPPLIVLPCRLLEQMAGRAQQLGDAFRFNVSGQVYAYGNWNYLLPTMMEIPYERDNLSP